MKPDSWTEADDALLRSLYNTKTPMSELCARFGRSDKAIYRRGYVLGIHRRRLQSLELEDLMRHILTLGAKPEGVSSRDVDDKYGAKYLDRLVAKGFLHRGKLGHKSVRFFTSRSAAEAYVSRNLPAFLAAVARRAPKATRGPRWSADTPMRITPETIFTYAPPPPDRVWHTNTFSPL